MRVHRKQLLALFGLVAMAATVNASAATYAAIQDTMVYQPVGNLGAAFGPPTGDSGGLGVWNHEAVNGAQSLLQFDAAWMDDVALAGPYEASLFLYASCEPGGFITACVGEPGAELTMTDVFVQGSAWSELDPTLGWDDISNTGLNASFAQDGSGGWIEVDVTELVAAILVAGVDFGFSLSQEAYPVSRTLNGDLAVSFFCDSESSEGACGAAGGAFAPYLEIRAVPVPAAAWLFGAALTCLGAVRRRPA